MSSTRVTFSSINVGIVKSVMRKIINDSGYATLPFDELKLNMIADLGYGFSLSKSDGKNNSFVAVRAKKGLRVYFTKTTVAGTFKKMVVICDEDKGVTTSEIAKKAYEKYCISTIMSLIKLWEDADGKVPDIKDKDKYKY